MSIRLFGTAVRGDGSKVNKTATISTSWNGQKAYPVNGQWNIVFGNNINGQRITVYVDGRTKAQVLMNGDQCLNIVI